MERGTMARKIRLGKTVAPPPPRGQRDGAGIKHRHQDTEHIQRGIQTPLDEVDGRDELAYTLQRQELALDRNHDVAAAVSALIVSNPREGGSRSERSIAVGNGGDGVRQAALPFNCADQIHLRASQGWRGGDEVQVTAIGDGNGGPSGNSSTSTSYVVCKRADLSTPRRRWHCPLRIHVDQEHPVAALREVDAGAHGGRRLADAALLVGKRNHRGRRALPAICSDPDGAPTAYPLVLA